MLSILQVLPFESSNTTVNRLDFVQKIFLSDDTGKVLFGENTEYTNQPVMTSQFIKYGNTKTEEKKKHPYPPNYENKKDDCFEALLTVSSV